MDQFDVRTRKLERAFIRGIQDNPLFYTGNGKANEIISVNEREIVFRSIASDRSVRLSRSKLQQAVKDLLLFRSMTRKGAERYHNYSSALLGLLRMIFGREIRTLRLLRGLLKVTLLNVRHFFSGLDRGKSDMELVKSNGGHFILLNYFNIRRSKLGRWSEHVRRLGFKGVLLDCGAFSIYRAKLEGKSVPDLDVRDYADFIEHYKELLWGYFTLDVIGDDKASEANYEYLLSRGLNPIRVWHPQTGWERLACMVKERPGELIAVGGTALMSKKQRRAVFDELFSRFPDQSFHGLGVGVPLISEYPWHSCDSSSWLAGRTFRRLLTWKGQKNAPATWEAARCLSFNVRTLARLELI